MRRLVLRAMKCIPLLAAVLLLLAWPGKSQNSAYFYVASAVDQNGMESIMSNELSFTAGAIAAAPKHTVTLTIAPSPTPTVIGYNIWRGTKSGGPYTKLNGTLLTALVYADVFTPPNPPALAGAAN